MTRRSPKRHTYRAAANELYALNGATQLSKTNERALPIFMKNGLIYDTYVRGLSVSASREHHNHLQLYKTVSDECKEYLCEPIKVLTSSENDDYWVYIGNEFSHNLRFQKTSKRHFDLTNEHPPYVQTLEELGQWGSFRNSKHVGPQEFSTNIPKDSGCIFMYDKNEIYRGMYVHCSRCSFTVEEAALSAHTTTMHASRGMDLERRALIVNELEKAIACLDSNCVAHDNLREEYVLVVQNEGKIQIKLLGSVCMPKRDVFCNLTRAFLEGEI